MQLLFEEAKTAAERVEDRTPLIEIEGEERYKRRARRLWWLKELLKEGNCENDPHFIETVSTRASFGRQTKKTRWFIAQQKAYTI